MPQDGAEAIKTLDESYAARALDEIRAAVKGNGAKPDDVRLTNFAGQITCFRAATRLSPAIKTSEKTVSGKAAAGESFKSPQAMREAVEKFSRGLTDGADAAVKIRSHILSRPDKGFGLKNESISLPFLSREFFAPEQCRACAGQGEMKCQRCAGQGWEICARCQGQGMEICPQCRGSQFVQAGDARKPCPRCQGRGRSGCAVCDQRRKVQCPVCRAKGAMPCKNCGAQGWHTLVASAEAGVTASFDYDRAALPSHVAAEMEKLGDSLAAYADFTPLGAGGEAGKAGDLLIHYDAQLPSAEMEVSFRERGEDGARFLLLGKEGRIVSPPAFLEPLLRRGMLALKDAAEGRGDARGKISEAGKFRTVRNALLAAVKYPPAKAARLLEKNTPLGASRSALEAMARDADRALRRVTARSRLAGLIAGIAAAAALYGAYILTPLRKTLTGHVPNPAFWPALDLLALGAGVFTAIFALRFFTRGAMAKALAGFFPPGKMGVPMPRTGKAGLAAALICLFIFIALAEISLYVSGASVMEWYEKIWETFHISR